RQQVQEWMELGMCRSSTSRYASPAFVVEHTLDDGSIKKCLVIDYVKTINPITKRDPFPVQNMDEIIRGLTDKLYKSKFDVRNAFLTKPVREEDIHKTAFALPGFHLEFMRMPFGQINGPFVLARLMEPTFGPLFDDNVNVY